MTIHIGMFSELPPQVRTIVLLGRRSSDHLRELIRIAEFKGRLAYRIENAAELQPRWFVGAKDIGVVVGADDLEGELRAVIDRLQHFAAVEAMGMLEGVASLRD